MRTFGILYKKPEADKVYNAEISFYCKKFICTQGAEPVEVGAENGFAKSYPSEKMKPVSTIGAGDNLQTQAWFFGLDQGSNRPRGHRPWIDRGAMGQSACFGSRILHRMLQGHL